MSNKCRAIRLCVTTLIMVVFMIIFNYNDSKAYTSGLYPANRDTLLNWLVYDNEKYIKMDPVKVIDESYNGRYATNSLNVYNEATGYYYINCLENLQNSQGSAGLNLYDWRIVNIIDIKPNGDVTIYYKGGKREYSYTGDKDDANKRNDMKMFQTLAYLHQNYALIDGQLARAR